MNKFLIAGAGFFALVSAHPAQAQGWQGASPFIVGTADHGLADRPSGDFNFMDGSAGDGSVHMPRMHSHFKMDSETMEELGAMIGLGLFGLNQMNSGDSGAGSVSHFASVLPPAGFTSTSNSGSSSGTSLSGTTAPVPEFGTGVSFGLMAMLGVAGLSVSRRKRRVAA